MQLKRTSLILAACGTLWGAPAWGQSDGDRSSARATAKAGQEAFVSGDYESAVRLVKTAESLVHAPTHLLILARAHEKLGEFVEAQEAYRKLIYEKLEDNAPSAFVEAQEVAKRELTALEPKVPHLVIEVKGSAEVSDLTVWMGHTERQAVAGVPLPVNPGTHQVRAEATGYRSDEVQVRVVEGQESRVQLTFSAVVSEGESDSAIGQTAAPNDETREPKQSNPTLGTGGWIGIGLGAAGVISGTALLAVGLGKRGEANDLCGEGNCPLQDREEIRRLDKSANLFTGIAIGSYAFGAVAISTGITLLVLSKKQTREHAFRAGPVAWTPMLSPRGVAVAGSF